MNRLWGTVRADLGRCVSEAETSAWGTLRVIWREMGLQAILVYRLGRLLRSCQRHILMWPLLALGWLVYALAARMVRSCYGIHLSVSADIGAGFWVGHFGGVEVVNCRIGEHCSVGQQSKVGRAGEPEGPRIGNGVWIGAHARVTGPIAVGDAATIAPGARVTRNVPSQALVVGNPGRVAFRGYINTPILPKA